MADPIQPHLALDHLQTILATLYDRCYEMDAQERDQAEAAYAEMLRAYHTARPFQRGGIVVRFLEILDALPTVRTLIGDLLDATRGEADRGSGDGPDPDALPLRLGAIWAQAGPPDESGPPLDEGISEGLPTANGGTRGGLDEGTPPPPADAPTTPALTRFPEMECPARPLLNKRFVLFVRLLREAREPGMAGVTIADTEPEPPSVDLFLVAPGFSSSSNFETLTVDRAGDTEARFVLTPTRLGNQTIRIEFNQNGKPIGTLSRAVTVVERADEQVEGAALAEADEMAAATSATALALRSAFKVPPPDLELRVVLDDDKRLVFSLRSPKPELNWHDKPVGDVTLSGTPRDRVQAAYTELSQMAKRTDPDPAAERRLTAIGRALWDEIIPEPLKREYWKFRSQVKSLLVTSDEPWIPWELVKPWRRDEETNAKEEDPFWCQSFAMARWLAGEGMADELPRGRARPVASSAGDLLSALEEVAFIEQLGDLGDGMVGLGAFDQCQQVLDLLDTGGFAVLHFACHGNFKALSPMDAALTLTDGDLTPADVTARFTEPRPLIFLNACHSGQMDFALTGLGGWAERLARDARAGAFVGAMWEVNDQLALQFAKTFYRALFQRGAPIAQALREARETIREAAPHNSTWLAYTLYADPEGRARPAGP